MPQSEPMEESIKNVDLEDNEKNLSDWDDDSEPENISSLIRQRNHHHVSSGIKCTSYQSSRVDYKVSNY